MAKQSGLTKAIRKIKKFINSENLVVTEQEQNELRQSLGFNIKKVVIKPNIVEQTIDYVDIVFDEDMFDLYIRNNTKYIKKMIDTITFANSVDEHYKFRVAYNSILQMIHDEYEERYFSNEILNADQSKMTQLEAIAWDSLFRYVKYNVLYYTVDAKLDRRIIQKLKELQNGRICGNHKLKTDCRYSFETILTTFKFCYFDIQRALATKSFESDLNKINYICAIVRDKINVVIERTTILEKATEELVQRDLEYLNEQTANYQRKISDDALKWVDEDEW